MRDGDRNIILDHTFFMKQRARNKQRPKVANQNYTDKQRWFNTKAHQNPGKAGKFIPSLIPLVAANLKRTTAKFPSGNLRKLFNLPCISSKQF